MVARWLGFNLNTIGAVVVFFASLFAILERDAITGGLAGLSVSFAQQVSTSTQLQQVHPGSIGPYTGAASQYTGTTGPPKCNRSVHKNNRLVHRYNRSAHRHKSISLVQQASAWVQQYTGTAG